MNNSYTLREIADWQLKQNCEVTLPSIQRGFVWKPNQVENLWDSVLRGYPIGSFLLSDNENGTYDLMDGQQRATAIFLGYLNPYTQRDETSAWSIRSELPVVWLDVCPKSKPKTSEYLVRVVTRSHPWGYQEVDNANKLPQKHRRDALAIFRQHQDNRIIGYSQFKNTTVFPYAACMPLPLSFILEAGDSDSLIQTAKNILPDYFRTLHGGFQNKSEFIDRLFGIKRQLDDLICAINSAVKARCIHCDTVQQEVLKKETEDDPTLFVRINSSGTDLSGDDLVYSVYKSIYPDAKDLVERSQEVLCYIAPTQIIALAIRIAWSETNDNKYSKKRSVKEFQGLRNNGQFVEKLNALVHDTEGIFKPVIDALLARDIMPETGGGLPPVLVKQFVRKSQDLFYAFACWLRQNKEQPVDAGLKLRMLAKLLTLSWFGIGDKKYVDDNWQKLMSKDFWLEPVIPHPIDLSPQVLFDSNWGSLSDYQRRWRDMACKKHELVLFAQREFINVEFSDFNQMESLEDSNVPWDFDHIYPKDWVSGKHNVPPSIKNWVWANGNYRAISLEQNRSESDHVSPSGRLCDEMQRRNAFVLENDWCFWSRIKGKTNDGDLVEKAIRTRTKNIYQRFWSDLRLVDILPSTPCETPTDHLILGTWEYDVNGKGYTRTFDTSNVCELKENGKVLWRKTFYIRDNNTVDAEGCLHVINSDGTLSVEGLYIAKRSTQKPREPQL